MTVAAAALLPWGTVATLQAAAKRTKVLLGPAQFNAAGLHLRVIPEESATHANAKEFRAKFGYSPMKRTAASAVSQDPIPR
jgi:hypothetical protein